MREAAKERWVYVRYRGVAGGCDSIMPSKHATICSGNALKPTSLLDKACSHRKLLLQLPDEAPPKPRCGRGKGVELADVLLKSASRLAGSVANLERLLASSCDDRILGHTVQRLLALPSG